MDKKKKTIARIAASTSSILSSHFILSSGSTVSTAVASVTTLDINQDGKKRGRYLRNGSLPGYTNSVWYLTRHYGDELEFLHFTSLSRSSFFCLSSLLENEWGKISLHRYGKIPQKKHLKQRMYDVADTLAMVLKYVLSMAEKKDIHVQFGAVLSVFDRYVELGMSVIIKVLMNDERARVVWDRSVANLEHTSSLTNCFFGLPGKIVGMIDGTKIDTYTPGDWLEQNRDYNGWKGNHQRNLMLLWDPKGKIIDAAVKLSG